MKYLSALFVEVPGPYTEVSDYVVFPYGIDDDARAYKGPFPVVAHPPCKRWGRYWGGGPSASFKRHKGDDLGCFDRALWAVRTFGGVLEHPEASHAWSWYGLRRPPRSGGWVEADEFGGMTCCVEQGHYGHRARKATWLYAVDCDLPELVWGPSEGERLDQGYHSREREAAVASGEHVPVKRLSPKDNLLTPLPFRDVLLGMAASSGVYR